MTISVLNRALGESKAWRDCVGEQQFADVPAPEFSLGLASKLLLDEAVRAFFATTSSSTFWISTDGEVRPDARREVERMLEVYEDAGWIDDPKRFHPEPPDLERVRFVDGRRGHHRFEHMTFDSGYEPHSDDPIRERWLAYEGNRTAHAWVLRHSHQENRPWMICLHGIGMGTPYTDFPAFRRDHLYEKLGFNVLWYVKPFHGPRGEGVGPHEAFNRGLGNLAHTQAQAMWDLRRIIGWIEHQNDSSIGVYGLSLGGYAASLLSTLHDGLDVVVAGIPGTDFVDLLSRNVSRTAGFDAAHDPLASFWSDARRAMQVVSPYAGPCLVPREGRFIFAGLVDRLTPPDRVRDLWLHWEKPRIAWYQGSHVSFILEPDVRALLDEAYTRLG
jgi:hypothetical protein